MTAFTATCGYEARMQLRRPAFCVCTVVFVVLVALMVRPPMWSNLMHRDPKSALLSYTLYTMVLLPIGYAYLLADRLVRDDRLGVTALLDAAPADRTARLLGKYLSCCVVTAAPIGALYIGFAAAYALHNHAPVALAWALALFGAIIAPALLFVGAMALAVPLVTPMPVFRILFAGYWVWTSYLVPPASVPTLAQTVVYPMGGYPIQVFFSYHVRHHGSTRWAGPEPDAMFNFLRPEPTLATACLSIAALLILAAAMLTSARLLSARRAR